MDATWRMVDTILGRHGVQVAFVTGVVVLVPVALLLGLGLRWSAARVMWLMATGGGLALIAAVTLGRGDVDLRWHGCLLLADPGLGSPEAVLNLALFVPAAFTAVLATRRPMLVAVAALFLSGGIELAQGVLGNGACQSVDVIRNTAGAAATALVLARVGRPRPRRHRDDAPAYDDGAERVGQDGPS